MKALYFSQHGGLDELRYGDLPTPTISADEVLIKVKACALNHLDLWVLRGWPGLSLAMPHIGGADVTGEIAGLGANVSGLSLGQAVVVCPGFLDCGPEDEWTKAGEDTLSPRFKILGESRPGGFAECIAVPAQAVVAKPDTLDFFQSASCLLAGITALQMLRTRARLAAGETVLIIGAGGGLNSCAIQIAKYLGARVIALTSNAEKAAKAGTLGADAVINYREQPLWAKEVKKLTGGKGADVVVDNVGKETISQSLHAASRGGRVVTVGNTSGYELSIDNRFVFGKQISYIGSTMGTRKDFEELLRLLSEKKVLPVIDSVLPLNEGRKAFEMLQQSQQFGKVILQP